MSSVQARSRARMLGPARITLLGLFGARLIVSLLKLDESPGWEGVSLYVNAICVVFIILAVLEYWRSRSKQ